MKEEIQSIESLLKNTKECENITNKVFQEFNFKTHSDYFIEKKFEDCIFLGCVLGEELTQALENGKNNLIFPKLKASFEMYRSSLYSTKELYKEFSSENPSSYKKTTDYKIFEEYLKLGRGGSNLAIETSLTRRLHDHAITDALYDYLEKWDSKKIVAIMGGHNLSRSSKDYKKVLYIAKYLAENNHLLVSGGGPGAMEATHLGAWLAFRPEKEVLQVLAILAKAPLYDHPLWLSTAFDIMEQYPCTSSVESLSIPTWFYGHEPSTPFSTHIAKYFANSVREDGLLAIAKGGIIFSPGSAGTIQEIFQETTQNHYKTYGNVSPMVFLNKKYWMKTKPVYPLLKKLSKGLEYGNLLSISDRTDSIIKTITTFTNN